MARPSNTSERRAQIVQGLLRVMSEHGYERASIAEIAKTAELTTGLIHYHFKSKQQILLALIEWLGAAFEARLEQRFARAGDEPRRRLHAFIDAHLAVDEESNPAAVAAWVAIGAEAIRQPEVRAIYQQVTARRFELLRDLVAACLRHNAGSAKDAKRLAAAILAAIEGAFQLSATAPLILPAGYAAPSLRRMVDGALDAP